MTPQPSVADNYLLPDGQKTLPAGPNVGADGMGGSALRPGHCVSVSSASESVWCLTRQDRTSTRHYLSSVTGDSGDRQLDSQLDMSMSVTFWQYICN